MLYQFIGLCLTVFVLWLTQQLHISCGIPKFVLELAKESLGRSSELPAQVMPGMSKRTSFGQTIIMVSNEELISDVLRRIDDFPIITGTPFFSFMFGNSVMELNGAEWRRHRLVINSCLKQTIHDEMMATKFDALVRRWTERVDGGDATFDITEDICLTSFSIMANFAFGRDLAFDGDEAKNLYTLFLGDVFVPWEWTYFLRINPRLLALFSQKTRRAVETTDKIEAYLLDRLYELESDDSERTDMLSMMARNRPSGFTDEEIIGTLFALFYAGHDTVSSAINQSLYYLSLNSGAQHLIREEIHAANGDISQSTCPLLHAAILESLRLFTPAPNSFVREVGPAEGVSLGGEHLPQGTVVSCFYHGVNRSSEVWGRDSEKFCPDRFFTPRFLKSGKMEIDSKKSSLIYSFGGGKRCCPGRTLAIRQIAVALSRILPKFNLKLAQDIRLRYRNSTGIWSPAELVMKVQHAPEDKRC